MAQTELEEIKSYWEKKFPLIDIRLWSNDDDTKFFGQIMSNAGNEHFQAETIGELISQGEQYLRKVT